MIFTEMECTLAARLFDAGAVQFGAFSGLTQHAADPSRPPSPIYFNLRTPQHPKPGQLTPELLGMIGRLMAERVKRNGILFQYLGPLPRAGDPIADALREQLGLTPESVLRLRKEEGGRRIIGPVSNTFVPNSEVLVVDDVATHGDAKREGISLFRHAALRAHHLIVAVDRQQGAREQLAEIGCDLDAIFTLSEMLTFYVDTRRIDAEKRDEVLAYTHANRAA